MLLVGLLRNNLTNDSKHMKNTTIEVVWKECYNHYEVFLFIYNKYAHKAHKCAFAMEFIAKEVKHFQ